jgi:hypothetical protein
VTSICVPGSNVMGATDSASQLPSIGDEGSRLDESTTVCTDARTVIALMQGRGEGPGQRQGQVMARVTWMR